MHQLTQSLKNGQMNILDVPLPALQPTGVLVRNHFSVISAGTEGKKVKDARLGYIGKAKVRQAEVKKVVETAKNEGVVSTYKKVMNKLDAPSPLGYSCAGEVIAVGSKVSGFKVGDKVACGGAGAVHAEVVSVPKHLCAKVPDGVKLNEAAFATIASIALQGIRQADLKLGENCVVIGLGLVGQLTVQLLNAAGVRTIGIDIDPAKVALAKASGVSLAFHREQNGLEKMVAEFTGGFGSDAVIITAGTSSLDPVELAGDLSRQKGKVVIVGAVPTGFSRANYYQKELDLRMSCSYGPGRYDSAYEEKGLDYPIGYVRWTENRNMQAYLQLLADKKLNIGPLISHVFDFENAQSAYDLILTNSEPYVGILLKYNVQKEITPGKLLLSRKSRKPDQVNIGFIGAGSFAQNFLLPNVQGKANLVGVATARGNNARYIAEKYGFQYATGNAEDILRDDAINTVFIATRHHLHAEYVVKALQAQKHVFVEKPLALSLTELVEIRKLYEEIHTADSSDGSGTVPEIMVGFNRRFAPFIERMLKHLAPHSPKAIHYRINIGTIPADHWTQDPEMGGGRIIGEICHFVDLCMFLACSKPVSVYAASMDTPENLHDTVIIGLKFANGSVANISYFANGSKTLEKEYLEVYCNGVSCVVKDFRELVIHGRKTGRFKSASDKGHAREIQQFISAIRNGTPIPVSFEDLYISSLMPFKIIESIQQNRTIPLFE